MQFTASSVTVRLSTHDRLRAVDLSTLTVNTSHLHVTSNRSCTRHPHGGVRLPRHVRLTRRAPATTPCARRGIGEICWLCDEGLHGRPRGPNHHINLPHHPAPRASLGGAISARSACPRTRAFQSRPARTARTVRTSHCLTDTPFGALTEAIARRTPLAVVDTHRATRRPLARQRKRTMPAMGRGRQPNERPTRASDSRQCWNGAVLATSRGRREPRRGNARRSCSPRAEDNGTEAWQRQTRPCSP